jgi:hypothetical protein
MEQHQQRAPRALVGRSRPEHRAGIEVGNVGIAHAIHDRRPSDIGPRESVRAGCRRALGGLDDHLDPAQQQVDVAELSELDGELRDLRVLARSTISASSSQAPSSASAAGVSPRARATPVAPLRLWDAISA